MTALVSTGDNRGNQELLALLLKQTQCRSQEANIVKIQDEYIKQMH